MLYVVQELKVLWTASPMQEDFGLECLGKRTLVTANMLLNSPPLRYQKEPQI
jgi:hypothetical protein